MELFGILLFTKNWNEFEEKYNMLAITKYYIDSKDSNDERAKEAYVKGFNDLHKQMKNVSYIQKINHLLPQESKVHEALSS